MKRRKSNYYDNAVSKAVNSLLSQYPLTTLGVELKKNRLNSEFNQQMWIKTAEDIIKLFSNAGINYVLMKVFTVPYAQMDDVDIIVEDQIEANAAINILRKQNYSLYRDRFSLNPLKVTAIPHGKGVQVDIYPEATWFNMRYAPQSLITLNRVKRKAWGLQAYLPSYSLDFYIVATHSYNHGFVSLAEAAHIVRLIRERKIDWAILKNLARMFRLNHALIIYLKIAQECVNNPETNRAINSLAKEILTRDFLSRIYSNWYDNECRKGFPIIIPLKLRIFSAFVRLFTPSLRFYASVYDELAGYMLALLFRGDRRSLV